MKLIIKYGIAFCLLLISSFSNAQLDYVFADAKKPISFQVPVDISDSLPKTRAWINGDNSTFIVDIGAPYLVINANRWQEKVLADSTITARGVGGALKAGTVQVDSFYWQGIAKANFRAVALNLPLLGDSISGLLGYDVFKDYEITFNYPDSLISFFRADSAAERTTGDSVLIVPFTLVRHLPVIKVKIGADSLRMAIDCGSVQNLIKTEFIRLVKDSASVKRSIVFDQGVPALIQEGNLTGMEWGDWRLADLEFRFDDPSMSRINLSLPEKIDGMLGFPFLNRYKITLNYHRQLLIIDARQNSD